MSQFVYEEDPSIFSTPKWADLTPIPVAEGDATAVKIFLSEEFEEIMSYFRAILKKDEKSERALELTEQVIDNNSANYTAWYFRRECLKALGSDLKAELKFVTEAALNSPKNYQIWYHRRAIADLLNDGSEEKSFTAKIIDGDSKNYHAWAHRQWALPRFNLWEGELEFTDKLLNEDLRNNSAWNQRWYVIQNTELVNGELPMDVIEREVTYAQSFIEKAVHNESPYNYIAGMMRKRNFSECPAIRDHAEKLHQMQSATSSKMLYDKVPSLLSFLVLIYEQDPEMKEKAVSLCEQLAEEYDTIRRKYWKYKMRKITDN